MTINQFANAFRTARRSRSLTQKKLAKMVGCSPTTIQRLESGRDWTTADVPVLVAKALDYPLSKIVRFAEKS